MNERIKELAVQAGAGELGDSVIAATMDIEKFAELIVLECASICYNSGLEDSEFHAQNLMYQFNIDGCRNDK